MTTAMVPCDLDDLTDDLGWRLRLAGHHGFS